jgi:16S rRNA processing protein RimM
MQRTLTLGKVARAHGLRGEVEIALQWRHSRALTAALTVELVRPHGAVERVTLAGARPSTRGVLVRFEGVTDRTQAEALLGCVLQVQRDALPPLGPNEYFLADLPGLKVLVEGLPIGVVEDVAVYPSVDVAVVRLASGGMREQPLIAPWIGSVRLDEGVLELSSVEGLIDTSASPSEGDA